MRTLTIVATAAALAALLSPAQAFTLPAGGGLGEAARQGLPVEDAQVRIHHGRRYCFYPDGWHGPGWYRCGYAWQRGLGWGGAYGWNQWWFPRHHHRFGRRDRDGRDGRPMRPDRQRDSRGVFDGAPPPDSRMMPGGSNRSGGIAPGGGMGGGGSIGGGRGGDFGGGGGGGGGGGAGGGGGRN